ncbi:hypothetical protein [Crocosphaera chwakensis]|uniref:Uncharacterized protein n=1 Tax=Crocosphaera chwakensis CCY0110 TaxID=391612 RepID=A3IMQ2_9CHRO|nr:hypothetical protein [Crocosphaera chwakensis]EAZ92155.1 hypothetical protein CY0110_24631 [Crocosphaera chwakensis CCY0110]
MKNYYLFFILPDDPVDKIHQSALAAALTDSLEVTGKVADNALAIAYDRICATVNGKIVVKAPDWAYLLHYFSCLSPLK